MDLFGPTKKKEKDKMIVTQYQVPTFLSYFKNFFIFVQWTDWPDHGIPQ